MRRGSIFSEILICGGGVCSILLLPLMARDNRCMHMAHVCFYVCCSHYACGKFVVLRPLLKIVFLALEC